MTALPGPTTILNGAQSALCALAIRAGLPILERVNGGPVRGLGAVLAELEQTAAEHRRQVALDSADWIDRAARTDRDTRAEDPDPLATGLAWITTGEAEQRYGLDESSWRRLARQGRITARWAGKGWQISEESAKHWATSRRHGRDLEAA